MQTLRKKTSPLKFKNETTRFLGDGVSFKAKLIGILEVSEARGDRMCQEALCDLKMAIRAAGEHKQRITVNIAIDGLRLRDEKTGDCLYHHPVHKISFIAQDMTDSRAFGYIFGSPDTGHRFFGIKTDKAASQVVIAMRDLFQVVFALKKKEIELAKQHLEKSYLPTSPLFSENPNSTSKPTEKSKTESKGTASASENKNSGTAVADLVDLELELNSLQQGLNQMERITPSDPFGSKDDPFGDSFISYPINKPILPPPPSSGRERLNRTSEASSTISTRTPPNTSASIDSASDSLFSSKSNKEFSFSRDINSSHDEPSSGDWFNPSFGNSIFEDPPSTASAAEPTSKDEKHKATKQEIMSQFDVFTELDPLGTGRSKPYIDKKHFFQELKNPPKKALNELASNNAAPPTSTDLFNISFSQPPAIKGQNIGSNTTNVFDADPFGEDPFVKEDPFADSDFSKSDPFETEFATQGSRELHAILQNNLSKSPRTSSLDKRSLGVSPKTVQFGKTNTFDVQFNNLGKKLNNLATLQGQSVEMSSEPESAPEPPPRPATTLCEIQPPPLPPKKQIDIILKPPPRPPHSEENRYDYIENFETDKKSISMSQSPPIPVPQRKSKFESDFTVPPERPKKHNQHSSDEDYLTPISFPERSDSPEVLLPPPERHMKKERNNQLTSVASYVESKPSITTSVATDSLNNFLEGLDMTLSQLTLSGLNDLASKLKIPPHKLSNMTLVQLTNYLSTFIKSQSQKSENNDKFPSFQADFVANFNDESNTKATSSDSYDRYAVFRELQEEIKQTKIDTEPEEIQEEKEQLENCPSETIEVIENQFVGDDKYAALREIVEIEIKKVELKADDENQNINETEKTTKNDIINEDEGDKIEDINQANKENTLQEPRDKSIKPKTCFIEYMDPREPKSKNVSPDKSPSRSPVMKSPVPGAITELIQSNVRLTSGSLSDVLSGSSPEVDNTGSNSDIPKKNLDPAGESWAIFDQPSVPSEVKDNLGAAQSEEGVSPWSSDSKEFGNRSPTTWKKEKPGDRRKKNREQEDWWDTNADPEGQYHPSNRRSTDSYDEEFYECYERPRRRRQGGWQQQGTGGHSSSSRDVSPWEEEPRRREGGTRWTGRHPRGHSFDRHRDVKHVDSWDDDEDDYEYDEKQRSRGHYFQRHGSKDSERHSGREMENDRWDDYGSERRYRRRREVARDSQESKDRWCCPDWEQGEHDKAGRYASRRSNNMTERRERYDERYRSSRESQDSPWEDEFSNEPDKSHSPHYLAAKKTWKQRPSSASEMDRKTGEIKSRHYLGTGGSDGERDRRYKGARRSRSRDSQFSEPSHRHKAEISATRSQHRVKPHKPVESDYVEMNSKKIPPDVDASNKKLPASRKKLAKENLGAKKEPMINTFPRKGTNRAKFLFDNDFVVSDESPEIKNKGSKFTFENDFDKQEAESPVVNRSLKGVRQQSMFDKTSMRLEKSFKDRRSESFQESKLSPRYPPKPKSPFEDDFSPSEKSDVPEGNGISSIKEEPDLAEEEEDSFGATSLNVPPNNRKKILNNKSRLSSCRNEVNLKKSGSVNIFTRENDPFDDDFFSCGNNGQESPQRSTELRWTEEFEDSDSGRK